MKKSILKLSAILLGAFVASSAVADDKDTAAKTEAKAPSAASAVASKLEGKLVSLKDGKLADHTLKGSPEFYVFYHSASW